jgi:hypothetical protein
MLMIALSSLSVTANAAEKTSANAARLEALKKLAGNWVEVGKDGKAADNVVSSIRVTSRGSVVQETLFPGSDHEMVTMYYLDGADLVLTHYCALGNQPRMRAEPANETNRLVFKFIGGGNLKSEDEMHMHAATLTLISDDHFKSEWTACKDGKPCHQASFDLVRKRN